MGYAFNAFCVQVILYWIKPVDLIDHIHKTNQNSYILNFIGQVRQLCPTHSELCLFAFGLCIHHHFKVK